MQLKGIIQNKYKLMAIVIGVYLLTDLLLHKGLARVLMPKKFPSGKINYSTPQNNNGLMNTGKEWAKGINTISLMQAVNLKCPGLECDIYFDINNKKFDVHHDQINSSVLNLDDLLKAYSDRGLQASVWLDFKNLSDTNKVQSMLELLRLRRKYGLSNKLLVESSRAEMLKPFADSGFYTAYYPPVFNPYLISDSSILQWADSLNLVVNHSTLNAISGYYYQFPFLHHYFPNYPILIWSGSDRFSLVNWWFRRKIASDNTLFIALYP